MNGKELREMITGILTEVVADNRAVPTATVTAEEEPVITHVAETTKTEESLIPDITGVDLREQLLLKNAVDPGALLKIKAFSPARLGVDRAGIRYTINSILRSQTDHAAVQDVVLSDVSEGLVKETNFISIKTICNNKDEYLTRPDYSRQFGEESSEAIRKSMIPKAKIQVVVGDGLSSATIEASIKEALPTTEQGLDVYNLDSDNVVLVEYCHVPTIDEIGEITDANVVHLLVGERPSLVTVESVSAYITYKSTVGIPGARWVVISNIHKGGTPAVETRAYVTETIKRTLDKKKSGIDLKGAG